MVRSETHKYIVHPRHGAEELYDLVADPAELHNLLYPIARGAAAASREVQRSEHDHQIAADVLEELRSAHEEWKARAAGHIHPRVPSM